jgi:mono/diheme cytochrome c family protein
MKARMVIALLAVSLAGIGGTALLSQAAEETTTKEEACCPAGDRTLPAELIKKIPPGELHSPYQDYAKLAKEEELVKQFRLPGCNECHGGGGGGGFCPALSQGVWFWGNTDDVLFRLIALGSAELQKQGFIRYQFGTVAAPMPAMAVSIKSSDQLWKIIAFIRSINPPGTNPPEKVIPGKMASPTEKK